MRKCTDGPVQDEAAMVKDLLELGGSFATLTRSQIGFPTGVHGDAGAAVRPRDAEDERAVQQRPIRRIQLEHGDVGLQDPPGEGGLVQDPSGVVVDELARGRARGEGLLQRGVHRNLLAHEALGVREQEPQGVVDRRDRFR